MRGGGPATDTQPIPGRTVQLLYSGDLCGEVERMPLFATVVRQARQASPDALLVDAGGWAYGTRLSDAFLGAPMVEIMNELGYDAAAVGAVDLTFGEEAIGRLAKACMFPLLAADLDIPGVRPFAVVRDVALIGLSDATPFDPAKRALIEAMIALQAQGADFVVLLSHRGIEDDRALAEGVPGIGAIIGVGDAPIERIGDTVLSRGAPHARALGRLELQLKDSQALPQAERRPR